MKEFINVYEENQEDIEKFIITTLKNIGSILTEESNTYKKIFQTFPSMELLYITDQDLHLFYLIFQSLVLSLEMVNF